MGASESKPGASSQHIFNAEKPIQFSEQLTNSLQSSATSDSTRAKDLEHQIQSRVTAELEKLHKLSADKLHSIAESISSEPFDDSPGTRQPATTSIYNSDETSWTEKPLLNRIGDFFTGSSQRSSTSKSNFDPTLERTAVQREIDDLQKKLDGRKQARQVDETVRKAQNEVANCLKKNDMRPLDCWQEVENFKSEVGRLERHFVEKNSV